MTNLGGCITNALIKWVKQKRPKNRETVCEKKVEVYYSPAHREEIVEWECKTVLSQENTDALHTAATAKETSGPDIKDTNRNKRGTDIPF